MMYQRLAMEAFRSTADTEHQRHRHANPLIRQQEEQARHGSEREHHDGRDGGLASARPRYLGHFLAYFLQKLERADFCHRIDSNRVNSNYADFQALHSGFPRLLIAVTPIAAKLQEIRTT